jgi:hypothetical protein
MITPPEGFVLSEDTEAGEIEVMRQIGRHLVGLCFLARRRRIGSDPKKHVHPYFRSGIVMEFQDRWYWVTAGHILEDIALSQKDPDMVLESYRLMDHYGSGVIDKNAVPFNFEPAWKHSEHADSSGLDYGAVELGKLEQLALAKNNVRVLPMAAWQKTLGNGWDEYFMYGLPTDSIDIRKTPNAEGLNVRAKADPSLIYIEKFDGDPSTLPSTQFPRFYGKLSENWPRGEIDGMSGGPVFGFSTRTGEFGVIAIQSGWLDQRRITFACPVGEFCPRLIAAIKVRETP